MVNEDTQGNVSQLQAEVKRLKEQLAQLTVGQILPESFLTRGKMDSVLHPEEGRPCVDISVGTPQWQAQHNKASQTFPQVSVYFTYIGTWYFVTRDNSIGTEFCEICGKGE